jgi:hypothetical protein
MSRADESHTRFIAPPEYRRLAYRMFRAEGVRRRGGPLYRLGALAAWRLARQYPYPSLARRYMEALS